MKILQIQNANRQLTDPIMAKYCDTFFCKLRGLMFRRTLVSNEGLLLVQKRENRTEAAIHMFFMFVDLAVVWLNGSYKVVDVQYARRWRPMYTPKSPAKYILELPTEYFNDFQIGDQVHFDETGLV